MKHVICIGKTIANLYKKNKLVFFVFIMVQVVVTFAYLFFYTTVPRNTAEYLKNAWEVRTINMEFENPEKGYPVESLLECIENNGMQQPEKIVFYFGETAESESNLVAYYKPEENIDLIEGKGIVQEDIYQKRHVMVGVEEPLMGMSNNYKIGSEIKRGGITFKVIGIRKIFDGEEIPYTVGFQSYYLKHMELTYPSGITTKEKESLKEYFECGLDSVKVMLPKSDVERTVEQLFLILAVSACAGITAIVTFVFLFQFMLENNKRYFQILNLCGASGGYCILLLLEVFVMLFSGGFLLGLLSYYITIGKNIGLIWSDVGWVYLTFIGVILCVSLPTALRFIKSSKKEGI